MVTAPTDVRVLLGELYPELRFMAGRLVRREREGHTLQRTALVHEAFLRLLPGLDGTNLSRESFLALAAHQMRMILIDYARRRGTVRRGGEFIRVPLPETCCIPVRDEEELLTLSNAVDQLAELHARAAAVVEMKFFAGFTTREIAAILGTSEATAEADWAFARAWLYRALTRKPPFRA